MRSSDCKLKHKSPLFNSVRGAELATTCNGTDFLQGIGQLFAALVVGMARNPSMKEDLFTCGPEEQFERSNPKLLCKGKVG